MIAQKTIDLVKEASIIETIEALAGVKFDKAKKKCKCPVHGEKTASLSVKGNFFKCFGCGIAGDGISFAQSLLGVDYPGAIEAIAKALGIPVEYEKNNEPDADWLEKQAIKIALKNAAAQWALSLPDLAGKYLERRGILPAIIEEFAIGWGGEVAGVDNELALKAGIVRETNYGIMPVFGNRIVFPFMDYWGNVVGFTGRDIAPAAKIKYINSPEISGFEKSKSLYGIFQSKKRIKDSGACYVVEGQFDALALWQKGLPVVATSGWALSVDQVELIKKAGGKVVTLVPDNDKAGRAGLADNARKIIESGLICKVLFVPAAKDVADHLLAEANVREWQESEIDYIEWQAGQAAAIAESGGAYEQAEQVQSMIDLIELCPSKLLREAYLDKAKKLFKALKTAKLAKRPEDANLPEAAQIGGEKTKHGAEYLEFSYYQKGNTLWTFDKKNEVLISNFIIEPLYFIENEQGSQYVCRFTNANGVVKTRAMQASDLTTKNAFTNFAAQMGNFIFVGSDQHLGHIKMKVLEGVPSASIPKYLGWHTQFKKWVWANALYCPAAKQTYHPDKWGIIKTPIPIKTEAKLDKVPGESELLVKGIPQTIATIEDWKANNQNWRDLLESGQIQFNKYYFLPSANQIGESEETNIKKFKLVETSEQMTFARWAAMIADCYAESQNYIPMIGWLLGALFRDLIHKEYSWYPILNMFGAPEKGKSTAARSLARLFGEMEKDGINIESGSTETALLRFIATFQNSVIWINEYKNTISPKKIGALKALADGGGKMVGLNTANTETKSNSARSAAILSGQDMPTVDPALKSRCVTLEFAGNAFNYEAYKTLTEWEKKLEGGHIINYLMRYRPLVEKSFKQKEIWVQAQLLDACKKAGVKPSERLLLNNTLIYTPIALIMEHEQLPFSWDQVVARAVQSIKMETEIGNTSNDIEQFFNVLASCVNKTIEEGLHYQITKKGGKTYLYLRLQQVAGFYREAASRQNVNPLDLATLKAYATKHPSFIEYKAKNVRFQKLPTQTSAYIFDYDQLREKGIELWANFDLDNEPEF